MTDEGGPPPSGVLAERTHYFRMPPELLFEALTTARWWLRLRPGEVEPRVLETESMKRVVWSSFWPVSPTDTIEFDLLAHCAPDDKTGLRFRWITRSPPDERGIGLTRQRLNEKFGGDLRAVDAEWWWASWRDGEFG